MSEHDGRTEGTRRSDAHRSAVRRRSHSRRRFLQTAAVTGVATAFSGIGSAQFEDERIELGALSDGWVGQAPEEIDGVQNPTLNLEEGETYEVVWQNLDGVGHNSVVIDAAGEHLLETEIVAEGGETQSVEFEAESEMAEYYCGPTRRRCAGRSRSTTRRSNPRRWRIPSRTSRRGRPSASTRSRRA